MHEPIDQLTALLKEHTIRQPVIDYLNSVIKAKFDSERFAEEIAEWLAKFREEQKRLEHQLHETKACQDAQLFQLRQEQAEWEDRLCSIRDLLIKSQAESLEKNQQYLELLAELHRDANAVASQGVQRQRLALTLSFLPNLPIVVTNSELSVIFGGIEVRFPNPYHPPRGAVVHLALRQFDNLPWEERYYIANLLEELKNCYQLAYHPAYQLRKNMLYKMRAKIFFLLRRFLHERLQSESNIGRGAGEQTEEGETSTKLCTEYEGSV